MSRMSNWVNGIGQNLASSALLAVLGGVGVVLAWFTPTLARYAPLSYFIAFLVTVTLALAALNMTITLWRRFQVSSPPHGALIAQVSPPINGADDPGVKALTKRISAAEGELQIHETTMRAIEGETTRKFANEHALRESSFDEISKRLDDERAAQETWNEQTRQMMLSTHDMATTYNLDLRRALARLPNLIGWISTTIEMQDLKDQITNKRYNSSMGPPPSPTDLIDRFAVLSRRLQEYHLAMTGVETGPPLPGTSACPPHELAFFDWGDDWKRYSEAHHYFMQQQYHPFNFDTIYR